MARVRQRNETPASPPATFVSDPFIENLWVEMNNNMDLTSDAKFYVLYLGWKQCSPLGGRENTDHLVKQLVTDAKYVRDLARLTLKVCVGRQYQSSKFSM